MSDRWKNLKLPNSGKPITSEMLDELYLKTLKGPPPDLILTSNPEVIARAKKEGWEMKSYDDGLTCYIMPKKEMTNTGDGRV